MLQTNYLIDVFLVKLLALNRLIKFLSSNTSTSKLKNLFKFLTNNTKYGNFIPSVSFF